MKTVVCPLCHATNVAVAMADRAVGLGNADRIVPVLGEHDVPDVDGQHVITCPASGAQLRTLVQP